jgi:chorismate mutase
MNTKFPFFLERAKTITATNVSTNNEENIRNQLIFLLKDIHAEYKENPFFFLNLSQTTELLEIFTVAHLGNIMYQFQNTVCAMCFEPWCIKKSLGGCGIGYFGNRGQLPVLNTHAIDIRAKNHMTLTCIHRGASFWRIVE